MSIVGKLGGIEGQQTISEVVTPGGGSESVGLQLYGPYKASGTASIAAGETEAVALQNMEDVNGITVDFPDDTAALILPAGYSIGSAQTCAVQGVWGPYVYDGSWGPAGISLLNTDTGESTSSGIVTLDFYSTVEFPQES